MKGKLFVVFCITVFLIAACSSQPGLSNSSSIQPGSDASLPGSQVGKSEDFRAEANSSASVLLSWDLIEGAAQYLIELSFGGEYFPIKLLDADQNSFEDFPVPADTLLSYRLQAISGSEVIEEYSLSLTTPPIEPNPLVLEMYDFLPVSPFLNSQAPAIDPDNPSYDPNSFSLPGFDPETGEFDMDALIGEPIAVSADIGPEGGTVAVTDPNNITYTLFIPPGALEELITITLKPIETIEGLPLETLLGAIRIEPQGLLFEIPVFLSYSFPDEVEISNELTTINFASDGMGSEFYFVPYFEGDPASLVNLDTATGKTAKLTGQPFRIGPTGSVAIQQLGPQGVGQGTPEQIRKTIKTHPPTRRIAQKSNQAAGAQMQDDLAPLVGIRDDLAPLIPVDISKKAHAIEAKMSSVTTAKELAAVIKDFETYIYLHGDFEAMTDINNRIWDRIIDKTKTVFEQNKDMCLTENAFLAMGIGQGLRSPVGIYWKTFAEKFKAKHGEQLIKEIGELINKCQFRFQLNSDLTFKLQEQGDLIKSNAVVEIKIPLKIKLDPFGVPALRGTGKIAYQGPVLITTEACSPTTTKLEVGSLGESNFQIWGLYPQWGSEGELTNFGLDSYTTIGQQDESSFRCRNKDGEPVYGGGRATNGQSGDIWGGLFNLAHFPNEQLIREWKISGTVGPGVGSSGLLAEKVYEKANHRSYFGGDIDETTTFQIEKIAGKP